MRLGRELPGFFPALPGPRRTRPGLGSWLLPLLGVGTPLTVYLQFLLDSEERPWS